MASATRGYPKVGDEAFPGALGYNKQLQTFMDEGGNVYACRFSAAALYGMREIDMMEGVKPINPLDVLDAVLTARRERRADHADLDGVNAHSLGRRRHGWRPAELVSAASRRTGGRAPRRRAPS